jgi:large subunit ribosomal protein L27Ae
MVTSRRKTRKLRGKVTFGCGRIIKHRKHQGGRGNAGGLHHLRTLFDRYHPGYFGKHGMRRFHFKYALKKFCPTINLQTLWTLVPENVRKDWKAGMPIPVIDVTRAGYFKVLAKGRLPQQPVVVRAKFFSKHAEDKIKKAGGACILCP